MNLLVPEIVFACGIVVMMILSLYSKISLRKPFMGLLLVGIVSLVYFSMSSPLWLITDFSAYEWFRLFPSSKLFFSQNSYTVLFKILMLAVTLIIAFAMPYSWFKSFKEVTILLSIGILGALLAVSANDLMAMYLAIEMQALAFCILIPIGSHFPNSKEAAIKYFAIGALASSLFLYGISLIYIATQSTGIPIEMPSQGLGKVGLLLVMVAVLSKVGIPPFHFWLPDVYEGSPNYVTALLATTVKVMGIVVLFKIISPHMGTEMMKDVVVAFASLSMVWAALMALRQKDFKRLIGYSSIGHMGYILAIFLTTNQWLLLLFYTFSYLAATLGSMIVLMSINSEREEEEQKVEVFAGLSQKSSFLAFQMSVFLLSLAGIPFAAGFWGKFWVFVQLFKEISFMVVLLLVIAGITTVLSFFYYLKIIRKMYFEEWKSNYTVVESPARKGATLAMFAIVVGFVLFQVQVYHAL